MRREIFEQSAHGQTMLTPYGEDVLVNFTCGFVALCVLAVLFAFLG